MEKCIFCDPSETKDQVIVDTGNFIVIQSRRPIAPGHIMIIPKRHINSLALTSAELEELFKTAQKFFDVFKKSFNASGINLFTNIGQSAGQQIPHLHFHLISRTSDEKISPFTLINDKNLYKALQQLTKEEILEKVSAIKKDLDLIEV